MKWTAPNFACHVTALLEWCHFFRDSIVGEVLFLLLTSPVDYHPVSAAVHSVTTAWQPRKLENYTLLNKKTCYCIYVYINTCLWFYEYWIAIKSFHSLKIFDFHYYTPIACFLCASATSVVISVCNRQPFTRQRSQVGCQPSHASHMMNIGHFELKKVKKS